MQYLRNSTTDNQQNRADFINEASPISLVSTKLSKFRVVQLPTYSKLFTLNYLL